MLICSGCNKKIGFFSTDWWNYDHIGKLCKKCLEHREIEAISKAEAEHLDAAEKIISEKYGSEGIVGFILFKWEPDTYNAFADVGKAFISGAIGLSGPWLVAFKGNAAGGEAIGILICFKDGTLRLITGNQREYTTRIEANEINFSSDGICGDLLVGDMVKKFLNSNLILPDIELLYQSGSRNRENARKIIDYMHQSQNVST